MAVQTVYSRPLTNSWSGQHNPLATEAELIAATDPAVAAWTSFEVMSDNMRGYCLGYATYFANALYADDNRMQVLRQMLTLCGTGTPLICCASQYEVQQYSQLIAAIGGTCCTTQELAAQHY